MNVQVAHRLSGSSAIVDTNVVPGRAELRVKLLLRRLEQCEHRLALVGSDVKERGYMPDGDHERMTGADRVGIAKCERETIARQYPLRRQPAEGALGAAVHTARVQAATVRLRELAELRQGRLGGHLTQTDCCWSARALRRQRSIQKMTLATAGL